MHYLPRYATYTSEKYHALKKLALGVGVTVGVVTTATASRAAIDQNKKHPEQPPAPYSEPKRPTP